MAPGRSGEFDTLDPPSQCREQCLGLQAGDVLTHALVNAHAEGDIAGGVTVEVEGVGIVPPAGVAVGRTGC